MTSHLDSQLEAAAVLRDPLRRALYRYICGVGREVGRDEAARAVGAGRDRVASHLDRLAAAGLLDVSFRRLSGRTGPGAGRPSKLYRPSGRQIDISLPPRRYGVAAEVFAEALARSEVTQEAVDRSAWELGQKLGQGARQALAGRTSRRRTVDALEGLAEEYGFHPVRTGRFLTLANCPFRSLAEIREELVCPMNLLLFQGVLAGLEAEGIDASAVPRTPDGRCCVRVTLAPSRASTSGS